MRLGGVLGARLSPRRLRASAQAGRWATSVANPCVARTCTIAPERLTIAELRPDTAGGKGPGMFDPGGVQRSTDQSSAANRGADNALLSRDIPARGGGRVGAAGERFGRKIRLGHAPWPSIGRSRYSCNLKRPVYRWRTTRRQRTDCEAGGGFLNGKSVAIR